MYTIAVNTRLLKHGRLEGIGWFAWQSLRRIVKAHPEVQFHFLFDASPHPDFTDFPNVKAHVVYPPARRVLLYKWWFDYSVPPVLKRIGADIFVSPDGFLSLRTGVPQLPVMHDLNFEHHPEWLPARVAKFYRDRFPKFAATATRIATVSKYSAEDIHRTYGVPHHKIDVLYNGVNPEFKPLQNDEINKIREELTDGQPYFIYVGAVHPRKNLPRLLEAFAIVKRMGFPHKLLIAGGAMWRDKALKQVFDEHAFQQDIVFTGRLNPEILGRYVAAAEAMTLVPLFEGFGIPALEAFACEVPLIASAVTSLPEVCGDAAIMVDPCNVHEIAKAMIKVCEHPACRQDIIEKGRAQLQHFSWDKTAGLLWDSIEKVLAENKRKDD